MVVGFFPDGSPDRYLSGVYEPVGQQGSFGLAAKTLAKPPRALGMRAAIPFGRVRSLVARRPDRERNHQTSYHVPLAMKRAKSSRTRHTVVKRSASATRPMGPAKELPVLHPHAAGIDVGATEHYVCVPADAVGADESAVRSFGAFTGELDQLVEWLLACHVQTVAMESTGVYWIPLFQKVEAAGLEVVLVNARHLKQVPGRKTDLKDCQWIQRLHSYGLLHGSFRPGDAICRLRTFMRHRANLVDACSQQVLHMQRSLDQMNVHLHHVLSDLDGETGLRIVDAILSGQRDPKELVKLRDPRVRKSTVAQMEAALEGDWRAEHLWVLGQAREAYRFFHRQIVALDQQVEALLPHLVTAPSTLPESERPRNPQAVPNARRPRPKKKRAGNAPVLDFTAELTRICGVDLTRVVGFNLLSVLILISEIGVDMSPWRNAKAFCSWLGLCPGNKISGGKVLSSRTARVSNRVATLLRTLATAVGRSDTWLGSFHRRMKSRLGPAAANTATARKLACLIYHLLKYREAYIEVDRLVYEARIQRHRIAKLKKLATELGFDLVENKQAA
jgi:transposase